MRKITAVSLVNGEAAVCFDQLMSAKRKKFLPTVLIIAVACVAYGPTAAYDQTGGQSEDHRSLAVAYESIQFVSLP